MTDAVFLDVLLGVLVNTFCVTVFLLYPVWKICKKAGLSPAISLVQLLPFLGVVFCLMVLAFAPWSAQAADELEANSD